LALWLFSATSSDRQVGAQEHEHQRGEGDQRQQRPGDRDGADRGRAPPRRAARAERQRSCSAASAAASHSAARPASAIIFSSVLPAMLGQVAELRRHVALVMLGEDRVGDERALHPPFGDHAAALAEQVGVMPR
jgi:hypothetical protein